MSDWAEFLEAIADLLRALQWPLVAVIVGLFFGPEIRTLLRRMKSWKAMGMEGEFSEAVQQLTESTAQAAATQTIGPNPTTSSSQTVRDSEAALQSLTRVPDQSPEYSILVLSEMIDQQIVSHAQKVSQHLGYRT
jgi:hypothetical protein